MKISLDRLRQVLKEELEKYEGEPVLLPYDTDFLDKLLFGDLISFKFFDLSLDSVLTKIDYSNVNFERFKAKGFDFSLYTGIKINPQTIYEKNLSKAICKGVEFIGSFDEARIDETNFTGSKGAKINPQTILCKDLCGTICSDVEFIGPFDEAHVSGTNFTGSKGAKINPQKVNCRKLFSTICADVEFVGFFGEPCFDGVDIRGTNFIGSNYEAAIKEENEFREKVKIAIYANNKIEY